LGTETLWKRIKEVQSVCYSCRNELSNKTAGGHKMVYE
jgi:hypothetical protein